MSEEQQLTPKAIKTRQHILDTAIRLFAELGYEETTMREIAAEAECSLGLTYRYFASKDELVLAHYHELSATYRDDLDGLQPASMADLFRTAMQIKLEQITPFRESTSALFSAMMNPNSKVAVLGDNTADIRDETIQAFTALVSKATDAPREAQVEQITLIFYSAHLLAILFWLYDRTPKCKATADLLDFAHDVLQLLRPVLILPPVAKSLARLTTILEPVFGKPVR